jgi:PTH1 family peptidyl-tRNA hydrolase
VHIIVGLGNPGTRYEKTRHNVGFDVVREIAAECDVRLEEKRFNARMGKGRVAGEEALLVLPQTFMNLSGDSVGPMAGFYKVAREQVVVVHDDLDLPFGVVKVKAGGGHGGHNGLRDLTKKLGGADFSRVRVGIGRPAGPMDTKAWVLAKWMPEETKTLDAVRKRAGECVEAVLLDGAKEAMNRFNGCGPV